MVELNLSPGSEKKLTRLIDDLSFLTFPITILRELLWIILFPFLLWGGLALCGLHWMLSAKENRGILVNQTASLEEEVYDLDLGKPTDHRSDGYGGRWAYPMTISVDRLLTGHLEPRINQKTGEDVSAYYMGEPDAYGWSDITPEGKAAAMEMAPYALAYCFGDNNNGLNNIFWGSNFSADRWLSQKADVYQRSLLIALRNLEALRLAFSTVDIYSPHAVCKNTGDDGGSGRYIDQIDDYAPPHRFIIPNAPQIAVSMHIIDEQRTIFLGLCLVDRCREEDLLPRNTSIFADILSPQLTPGQQEAIHALDAIGTPRFWLAAAHANGIWNEDATITAIAREEDAKNRQAMNYNLSSYDWDDLTEVGVLLLLAGTPLVLLIYGVVKLLFRVRRLTRSRLDTSL